MGAALGAAAGLAGGAFLMHEGHEAHEHYEEDKHRIDRWEDGEESRIDNFGDRMGNDIENAPETMANWTGRKVGEVEDIPDRVQRKWYVMEGYKAGLSHAQTLCAQQQLLRPWAPAS